MTHVIQLPYNIQARILQLRRRCHKYWWFGSKSCLEWPLQGLCNLRSPLLVTFCLTHSIYRQQCHSSALSKWPYDLFWGWKSKSEIGIKNNRIKCIFSCVRLIVLRYLNRFTVLQKRSWQLPSNKRAHERQEILFFSIRWKQNRFCGCT